MKSKTVGVIVLSLYVCIITLIAIIHTFRCEENYSKTSVSSAGMNSTKTTIKTTGQNSSKSSNLFKKNI